MYLDGQKLVDNNGCHGEQEKSSGDTFVAKGTHRVTVDMCEMGGGEVGVFSKADWSFMFRGCSFCTGPSQIRMEPPVSTSKAP